MMCVAWTTIARENRVHSIVNFLEKYMDQCSTIPNGNGKYELTDDQLYRTVQKERHGPIR